MQEKWIYENQSKLQVPFIAAIDAVFDFYAGTDKDLPKESKLFDSSGIPSLQRRAGPLKREEELSRIDLICIRFLQHTEEIQAV